MKGVTLAELRHGMRRFVAPAVAILLGVAFLTATLALSSTMDGTMERAAASEVKGSTAVVSGTGIGPSQVEKIRSTAGVSTVRTEQTEVVSAKGDGGQQGVPATTVAPSQVEADSGRTTARAGEVVLNRDAASTLGARPGDAVTIGGSPGKAERRTVAGIVQIPGKNGLPTIIGSSDQITRWSGKPSYEAVLVTSNRSPEQVVGQLQDRLGKDLTVRTAAEETDSRVSEMVTGARYITMFFGLFAVIALFVAGMVIANTFQILLAQRARQLALMRCVGASRRQVTRSVVTESFVLGLVASGLGVLAGIGVVAGFVQVSDRMDFTALPMDQLAVSGAAVAVPLLLGIGVTVVSALQPARRASRVAPLAALSPELAPSGRSRASRIRLTLGTGLAVVGFGGMLLGTFAGQAPIAVFAGMLSFLGILLTAPVVVPALARRLGGLARRLAGVPGELATDNTVRNPRRTAATSGALLIGITLMASMLVGASTSKAAIDDAVDEQFALDVSVSTDKSSLPASVQRDVRSTDSVESSAALRSTRTTIAGPSLAHKQAVTGVPESARDVLRDPSVLNHLEPGAIVIDTLTAEDFGLKDGQKVRVGNTSLTVRLTDGDTGSLLVTSQDMRKVDPDAGVSAMWLRLESGADPGKVTEDLRKTTSAVDAEVSGAAGARAELDSLVRIMLIVVTALLGVAVLIALVGVANTLGLSVLERRRETALLRALGFTAKQVRRTLAIEALLVAVVAALVGTVLGVVYGWAGARSLLGKYAEGVAPQVPIGLLLMLVLGAAGCGLLASWAPARRAARTAPVAALASE